MWKKQLWVIWIIAVVITTTACSSSSEETRTTEKAIAKDGKTIVTLSIQESSAFYQIVEKKFEEKYPDIDLQIQSQKQAGEAWGAGDYEKYKKTTNTALLSGKGADIIEAGSLPIDEYMNKKLLVNLEEYLNKDSGLNKNDLQTNVLEAIKQNGGLYAIPDGYSLRAFIGDGDILANTNVDVNNWTWNEFIEVSKELLKKAEQMNKDTRYAMANDPPELILQEMVVDSYPSWVDHAGKKASFDSADFMDMLQNIKKMVEEEVITSAPADMGKQLFYSAVLRSPVDFIDGTHIFFSNPKLLNKPHNGQTGGMRIIPTSQFVIQANSPVKEEAWKFIAFLLSEEAQALQERQGFSLLKSVNEKQLDEIQQQVKSGSYKLSNGQSAQVSDNEFAQFKKIMQSGGQFAQLDGQVISIVGEEAISFFNGQKSVEEVAKLIQNRITTFLNE
ncbi:MAG: ABC transporter substrate-binding protein [Candidatus Pristimantibacillus sp.]